MPGFCGHHLHLAGRDIEPKGIEDLRVALVQSDQDVGLGDIGQIIDNFAPHFGERSQILHLAALQVHAFQVKILVAFVVHRVNDEPVSFPGIVANVAVFLIRQTLRLAAGRRTNENVHPRFPGLKKGKRLAIRREVVAAADRVLKKIAERDFRGNGGGLAACLRQRQRLKPPRQVAQQRTVVEPAQDRRRGRP